MSEQQAGVGPHLPPQAINVASGQTVRLQQVLTTAGSQNVNVISTRGQQFVITSQVPGLTQVITTIASTNPALQTSGATRIINLTPSRRVSVVGDGGTVSLVAIGGGGQPGVGVGPASAASAAHPTLVGTLQSPPRPRKRARPLSEQQQLLQERPPPDEGVAAARRLVRDYKRGRMRELCEQYAEHAAELFFLQAGGNMMDYHAWRKKPPTPQFLHFLRTHRLDPDDDDEDLTQQLAAATLAAAAEVRPPAAPPAQLLNTAANTHSSTVVSNNDSVSTSTSNFLPGISRLPAQLADKCSSGTGVNKLKFANTSRLHTRQHSISAVYDNSIGSQEQIAEKAKQEAYVMQRIVELQKEGLWSEKRLPKVQEPPRAKAHWDYLLEEMVWLAADFAQERKWKKAAAKKCAKNVQKYFQDKTIQAQRAEKVQELKLKKIAGCIAKEVKSFWNNIEKLVEFKQQTRLEEKRKKALDQHLSFIVDQTEKYSTWLTESMNKSVNDSLNVSVSASVNSSRRSSPTRQNAASDDDFNPNQSSTDDEETIAKEEEENSENHNHSEEIELLRRESELPIEDLLKALPEDYLNERDKLDVCDNSASEKSEDDVSESEEFKVDDVDAEDDDEETIQEQEAFDKDVDHEREISELKAEGEMSIEELMAKYGGGQAEEQNGEADVESRSDTENDSEDEVSESESEEEKVSNSKEDDLDLKTLMNENSVATDKADGDSETAHKEINDVAALAESIQPKGNTLSSTSVVTPVPFLLKHTLREYQHIGLDWLVTMFDRKLNGILADEMGLGKTIQTISLLAHLACEKGNWGPHLIIVPTSVMLNWEMELKKWCPSFKILTYYGTQKERKQKRTGWTKPNAFHVCITSYKLVIQDHQSFRRKKWKYLILDEAQNIKNFKSQRWQLLLNFQTQRRLLLTGTPLQNNLMELWSLMHFLMPDVFQSHKEFKEWFSNPVTGMIEGNSEYNESIIKRLHKVLRPFLLRRLKTEVEKQLPKKYEHVVMCRLSKRQRYLYDDFMSRAKTKETLASGNLLSVINVLMQLRKVCNHPNLFEVRPTISPFQMEGITYTTASLIYSALDYDPMKHVDLSYLNLLLVDLELCLNAFVAHRMKKYQAPRRLIEEIDSRPDPAPRCPAGKVKIHVRLSPSTPAAATSLTPRGGGTRVGTSPLVRAVANQALGQGLTLRVAAPGGSSLQGYSVQLVQHQGGVKAIPVPTSQQPQQQQLAVQSSAKPLDGVQRISVPAGFAQLVQTSMGRHILLTSSPQVIQASQAAAGNPAAVVTAGGQRLTVLSKAVGGVSSATTVTTTAVNRLVSASAVKAPVVSSTLMAQQGANNSSSSNANTTTSTSTATVPYSSVAVLNELKSLVPFRAHRDGEFDKDSVFYLPELEVRRRKRRREKLSRIHVVNQRRCLACPIYGSDLVEAVRMVDLACSASDWKSSGFVHCLHAHRRSSRPDRYWRTTHALAEMISDNQRRAHQLGELTSRFVLFVPAVSAPRPRLHVSHPPPQSLWEQRQAEATLHGELSPRCALLHPIASAMATQFPDPRLIQYDCGKLQVLDRLLRRLKVDHHRVLIFTQMTRMLDVLESFLNFHGHIYLRLDGTTRVDQRQMLMERFNADRRIFCFILSTRSGGIGVNLTGADTVIFYDSDWNPTMDAQAQDRCHRIGQTRDVHIYRLVSEMTVEENILKKANQKRLLGDLAIEGGNFTTAYFKKSTIQDLFDVDVGEHDPARRMADVVERDSRRERQQRDEALLSLEEKNALGALESALAAAEDETDVQAARTAKAEAAAELAEFDESIPLEEGGDALAEPEMSKAEMEVENLIQQLRPVELYAMSFVEETDTALSAEQLAAAEAEIEQQKREWELGRLQAVRDEEERRLSSSSSTRLDHDHDSQLTFPRADARNQNWRSSDGKEQMPMWCPPTPPQDDDNDVYVDYALGFLYEQATMSEAQLPPVYVKKEYKRFRLDPSLASDRDVRRPHKIRQHREESIYAPRSLFDRPSAALLKMRRDMKLHKFRGGAAAGVGVVRPPVPPVPVPPGSVKPPGTVKTVVATAAAAAEAEHVPDWLIFEDMALLQAVQSFLELPLNLMILSPAHTPNWDMVSDIVNNVSRTYRSPKQCRTRYESVIVPREEGKILYDTNPKKQQKKSKGPYKVSPQTKSTRPLRTSQLFLQDNHLSLTQLYAQRFETVRSVSKSRKPTVKPLLVSSSLRSNPKHAAILAECGINYDSPLSPLEVAANRAKRIQSERNALLQQRQAAAAKAASSSSAAPTPQQSTSTVASSSSSTPGVAPPPPPPAPPPTAAPAQQGPSVVAASAVSSSAAGTTTITAALRTQQRPVTALTVQDMVSGQVRSAATSSGGAVVSVASLSRAQVQRFATANLVAQGATSKGVTAVTSAGGKTTITPAQLRLYQQQQSALLRQQQRLAPQQIKVQGQPGQQKVAVALATAAGSMQQQRAQLLKQGGGVGVVTGKQTLTRPVSESEMAAMLKRQQQLVLHKGQGLTPAQILAQATLQVQQQQAGSSGGQQQQQTTQVATLVKTGVGVAGGSVIPVASVVKTQQQMRQLALQQQLLQQQRKAAAAVVGKAGVGAQLIVQSQKALPTTMTVQQIQQVIKHVQPTITHVSGGQTVSSQVAPGHVYSLAKGPQTSAGTRVASTQQALKQIQVVTAAPGVRTSVPNVTVDSAGRPQVSVASTLASALAGTIKVAPSQQQQHAILSQVTAALQGQQMSVAVRQQSPVRIQPSGSAANTTPLVAVSLQQQQQSTASIQQPGPGSSSSDTAQ